MPGFEPGIFWSVVRRVIRCATTPSEWGCRAGIYMNKILVENNTMNHRIIPIDMCIEHQSGWPSGLRRCVQVAVHFCGRGFESHFWQMFFSFKIYDKNIFVNMSTICLILQFAMIMRLFSLKKNSRPNRKIMYTIDILLQLKHKHCR